MTMARINVNGSIPALAGERTFAVSGDVHDRVYPRACGGTYDRDLQQYDGEGLSPRLRGNGRASRLRLR